MLLSAEQYFEQRRKTIDRYVQGEHAWFGDVTCALPSLSCYNPHAVPWYMHHDMDSAAHDRACDLDHGMVLHDACMSTPVTCMRTTGTN